MYDLAKAENISKWLDYFWYIWYSVLGTMYKMDTQGKRVILQGAIQVSPNRRPNVSYKINDNGWLTSYSTEINNHIYRERDVCIYIYAQHTYI